MAQKISVNYILEKLHAILEDPDVRVGDKLKAIRMCGEYLKMFEENKRVQIDIRGIIGQLSETQLAGIASSGAFNDNRTRNNVFDTEVVREVIADDTPNPSTHLLAGGDVPTSPSERETGERDRAAS